MTTSTYKLLKLGFKLKDHNFKYVWQKASIVYGRLIRLNEQAGAVRIK